MLINLNKPPKFNVVNSKDAAIEKYPIDQG
jgi:hypothetical protein